MQYERPFVFWQFSGNLHLINGFEQIMLDECNNDGGLVDKLEPRWIINF